MHRFRDRPNRKIGHMRRRPGIATFRAAIPEGVRHRRPRRPSNRRLCSRFSHEIQVILWSVGGFAPIANNPYFEGNWAIARPFQPAASRGAGHATNLNPSIELAALFGRPHERTQTRSRRRNPPRFASAGALSGGSNAATAGPIRTLLWGGRRMSIAGATCR